jgi:hypothetical protein
VLFTSRRTNVFVLGVTQPVQITKLDANDAHDFLRRRTGRADASGRELEALVNLAEEVGYLPLALEQAAAYIIDRDVKFADYLSSYLQGGARLRVGLLEKMPPEMGNREKRSLAVTWLLNFEEIQRESAASADLLRFFAFLAPDDIPFELVTGGAVELGEHVRSALPGKKNEPLALMDLVEPLRRYSLVAADKEMCVLNIHRMVQLVVQANMDATSQNEWEGRAYRAVCASCNQISCYADDADLFFRLVVRLLPHMVRVQSPYLSPATIISRLTDFSSLVDLLCHEGRTNEAAALNAKMQELLQFLDKGSEDSA